MLAPGVPLTHPTPHWAAALARKAKVEIIGDIELFCRERAKSGAQCPLVAITGTNGKSTTTALIAHLHQERRPRRADRRQYRRAGAGARALRRPAASTCSKSRPIRSISRLRCKPTVGILLNVTEDHLDRHGTMENYAAIKERLVGGSAAAPR